MWPWDSSPDNEIAEAESQTDSVFSRIDVLSEQEQRVEDELNELRSEEAAYQDEHSIGSEKPAHLRRRDEQLAAARRDEKALKVGLQLGAVDEQEAAEKREQIEARREKAAAQDSRVPKLEEDLEEVRQTKTEVARAGLEPQVKLTRRRGRRLVESAAALVEGEEPLPALYERFEEARQAYQAAKSDLHRLFTIARGDDSAVNRKMKQQLEAAIAEPFEGTPPAASFGRLLADLLVHARRADSPWQDVVDMDQVGGSVHHSAAVGCTPDFLAQAQRGQYPADTTL